MTTFSTRSISNSSPARRCRSGCQWGGQDDASRILAGLIWPDSGTVALDGLTVASDRREYERRIGFVPAGQSGALCAILRPGAPRVLGAHRIRPSSRASRSRRAFRWRFGLEEMSTQRADRLSTDSANGYGSRMAFLHVPSLLLLDEPATSLDDDGLDLLRDAITSFVGDGGTGIWCAPTTDDVHLSVDAAFVLSGGEVRPT